MSKNARESENGLAATPVVHLIGGDAHARYSLTGLLHSANLQVLPHVSAESFLAEYDPEVPGCILADVFLPGMSGLALQSQLVERHLAIPLVMLTDRADVSVAVEALTNGATGFFVKPPRPQELVESIRKAIRFDKAHRVQDLRSRDIIARVSRLSNREKEVLNLVLDGCSNKQIAAQLGISFRTVETHRANIMQKLDAHSLARLFEIAFAYRSLRDSQRSRLESFSPLW